MNPGSDMPEKDKRRLFRSRPALREMRLRAGLTEQALAARLGVTYLTIQAWERGQRAVRKGWDFKLAEALGCSVADLRQAESFARTKRWRRAWVSLTDAPKAAARRPWDAEE